jgi:4-amino-4-deoxy-L-arabinose transferase-like glycosyltransferase
MKKRLLYYLAPLAALAAAALYIGVSGDFPLDDDWAYALSVKHLLAGDGLVIPDWASPTLAWHAAWGALWSLAAGFSHAALRLSTLALAGLGAFFFSLYRRDDTPQPALALVFNPLFLLLSFTFMTDVPYLAWSLLALLLYLRAAEKDSAALWLAGSAAAALAYLVRQTGVFLPAAALVFLYLRGRLNLRRALLPAALPAAVIVDHQFWYMAVHGPTWAGEAAVRGGTLAGLAKPLRFLLEFYLRGAASALYLCLFTLPFAVRALGRARLPDKKDFILAALAILPFLALKGAMPYYPGVIRETGLGVPAMGFAAEQLFKASGLFGSPVFWGLLALAAFGGLLFWTANRAALKEELRSDGTLLLALAAAPQLAAAAAFSVFFDRYLLAALPAALALAWGASLRLAPEPQRGQARAGWAALALLALWSVAGTADYMAWNRAKAGLAAQAAKLGIEARAFYNGFDRYGELFYEENMAALKKGRPLAAIRPYEWMGGKVFTAYSSFAPFPAGAEGDDSGGFETAAKQAYRTPLRRGETFLYLYRKKGRPFGLPAEW